MEQIIKCKNDTTKNAVRLCDDCNSPFCADCLRKNFFGFYYCQNCYPALFSDASTPKYEIPIDEKGLIKIQSKIQDEVNKDDNNKNKLINQTILGGACGIGLGILIFFVTTYRTQEGINFQSIVSIMILGLLTGILIALYKNIEQKNSIKQNMILRKLIKIIEKTIDGGAYGFAISFVIAIVLVFAVSLGGGDNSNIGFVIMFITPIFTALGMLIGFIIGIK